MPLIIYDTFAPDGDYPAVKAEDVEYQGKRLPSLLPVCVTQEEYDAMVADGTINDDTLYFIKEETT